MVSICNYIYIYIYNNIQYIQYTGRWQFTLYIEMERSQMLLLSGRDNIGESKIRNTVLPPHKLASNVSRA